jgi:hypothetical protein
MRFIERVNSAFLKVSNTKAFQELGKAAHDASPAADALERRPCLVPRHFFFHVFSFPTCCVMLGHEFGAAGVACG